MGRSYAPAQSFAGGTPSVVVGALAVFAEVEPVALGFLGHPEAGKRRGDEDRDRGADSRPDDRRGDGRDLDDKLGADAEVVAAGAAEPRRIDDAGADRADHAAAAVDAERVERVVIAKLRLQVADRVDADDRSHRAKHDRAERAAVARRRSSGDPGGDEAGAEAQGRTLVGAHT